MLTLDQVRVGKGLGFGHVGLEPSTGTRNNKKALPLLLDIILDPGKVRYQQHFTVKCTEPLFFSL